MIALSSPTRRGVVAAVLAASVAPATAVVASARHVGDRDLLTAFKARQHALAAIEATGDFFDGDTHSPKASAYFDEAEMIVTRCKAATLPGILAQLWIGLSYTGGQIGHKKQRERHDIFRRADLTALTALNFDDFEYDEQIIANAIVQLAKIAGGQS